MLLCIIKFRQLKCFSLLVSVWWLLRCHYAKLQPSRLESMRTTESVGKNNEWPGHHTHRRGGSSVAIMHTFYFSILFVSRKCILKCHVHTYQWIILCVIIIISGLNWNWDTTIIARKKTDILERCILSDAPTNISCTRYWVCAWFMPSIWPCVQHSLTHYSGILGEAAEM